MEAELTLDLPWVPDEPRQVGELRIRRARPAAVSFVDGVTLEVVPVDPVATSSFEDLVARIRRGEGPGRVALVAGAVPVEWRGELRAAGVSWYSPDGTVEIAWPRLRVSARRASNTSPKPRRQRTVLALQKRRGLVAQELCIRALSGFPAVSVSEIAAGTGVDLSIASRAVEGLAAHGLVTKRRERRRTLVSVTDVTELALLLAERTGWRRLETLPCYLWGRTSLEVVARASSVAFANGVDVSATGRTGASYLGIVGTAGPRVARLRVRATMHELDEIAMRLGAEPASADDANVALAADPWGLGAHRAEVASVHGATARIAHPLRVWCDIRDEERGSEFAAQLWGMLTSGR